MVDAVLENVRLEHIVHIIIAVVGSQALNIRTGMILRKHLVELEFGGCLRIRVHGVCGHPMV